jgi:hypothetical protein
MAELPVKDGRRGEVTCRKIDDVLSLSLSVW